MQHSLADQVTLAIADAIVAKRPFTLLRFSDGTPTEHGLFHPCRNWILAELVRNRPRMGKPPIDTRR